ncbi:hypothetical protein XarbCFBP6827_13285 [Xanthomonas arboricola]|nr:hypothetical protein XarbCFBP6827_13285 [Xanthomonas arboricola]
MRVFPPDVLADILVQVVGLRGKYFQRVDLLNAKLGVIVQMISPLAARESDHDSIWSDFIFDYI